MSLLNTVMSRAKRPKRAADKQLDGDAEYEVELLMAHRPHPDEVCAMSVDLKAS